MFGPAVHELWWTPPGPALGSLFQQAGNDLCVGVVLFPAGRFDGILAVNVILRVSLGARKSGWSYIAFVLKVWLGSWTGGGSSRCPAKSSPSGASQAAGAGINGVKNVLSREAIFEVLCWGGGFV